MIIPLWLSTTVIGVLSVTSSQKALDRFPDIEQISLRDISMSSEFTECLGEGGNNPLVAEDFLLGFTVTSLAPEIHKNSNILICILWLFIVWRYNLHAFLTSVHQKYNSLKKVLWVFKKKIFNNFRVLCYKLFYLPYLYLFVFWRKWRRTYLGSFIGHYEIVNCF